MFSVVRVHRPDAKPGPSHTVSHTSHIPSPALSSSESHTVQAVAVSDRSDCLWADFSVLPFQF